MVEHLFSSADSKDDSQLVLSFQQLCSDDLDLFSEFEIIRGTIALEEGHLQHAFDIFWKILHLRGVSHPFWYQVIEILVNNRMLIQASLFLRIALDRFPQIPSFLQLAQQISPVLTNQLEIPPGTDPSVYQTISLEDLEPDISPFSSSDLENVASSVNSTEPLALLSSSVRDLWNQALECFEEFSSSQDIINGQAFVHYAHSTLREFLGIEESFREGVDEKVARYQLTQFREFLIWLNQIRNKSIYEDYFPSFDEIHQIHTQTLIILRHSLPSSQER
jgi:hypothetical protein